MAVAASSVDIRLARIRRLIDSTLYFGSVLRQTESVIFVRLTGVDKLKRGDKCMFELKGSPDMLFVAQLLDEAKEEGEKGSGKTYRFGLISDVLPIGAL